MLDFFGSEPSQSWEKSTNANLCNFSGNIDGISDRAVSNQRIMGGVIPERENLENWTGNGDDSWILGKSAIAPQSGEDLRLESNDNPSSVDALTGENLFNSNDGNLAIPSIVDRAVRSAQDYLSGLATDPDFAGKMNLAFGNSWNGEVANNLVKAFAQGDFSEIPAIEILPSAAINGANGAFASVTNTIYLAKEFVEQNAGNPGAITSVILEETGHFIDSKINVSDAAGDEGDIFSRVVQGKELGADELGDLKAEDDTAVLTLNGQVFWIEQSTLIPQVNFRTFEKGKYVVAEGGGGSTVNANRDIASTWETFSLIDLNAGSLNSGDFVNIVTQNGRYMVAEGGGGGVVNANRTAAGPWEKFRVLKVNGSGIIGSGDTIALSASNGQYVVAEGGGGANVNANRNAIGPWEKFIINFPTAQPQIPANNWKAEYFNNINLTGTPVFMENLGDGSRGFSRNWGNGSPTNTPSDNFSAKMTTQRYLAPGLYKITTQADDGIRVRIGNQTVVNRWVDQPYLTNSGYFYSNGGNVPIAVEYYERGGGAAINFNIAPATKFQEVVNESQQWKATVYNWDSSQSSAPPIDFWQGDINNSKAIGVISLGSNTRSDGKKGINVNWGNGAPNGDGSLLPHDNFAIRAYTWADFDGSPYKFRVMGDDGFQILAKNQATGQWYSITPQNSWDQGYGPQKEITYTLPAGRYDMHFHQYEAGGDAYLNLDWEKVGNPDIDIRLDYFGNFSQSQKDLIEKAAKNWEGIITKDMVPSGILNIAVTQGSTNINGKQWASGVGAETYFPSPITPNLRYNLSTAYDNQRGIDYDTQMHFNSNILPTLSNNWLVRLATHEIGHALYLDEAQYDSLLGYDSVMDKDQLDQKITSGVYQRLETLGYSVDRNAPVYWS